MGCTDSSSQDHTCNKQGTEAETSTANLFKKKKKNKQHSYYSKAAEEFANKFVSVCVIHTSVTYALGHSFSEN